MWQFFVAFSCPQMKFGGREPAILLLSPLFFQQSMLTFIERTKRACFGSPEEVRDYLIDLADSLGTNTLLLNFNQRARLSPGPPSRKPALGSASDAFY